MKRLALAVGFLLLASGLAYANHGVVGQLNSGPVTWGSASIFSTDGGVCVLLDAGTTPASASIPTTQGFAANCQISSIAETNATLTACLYGSTDNGSTWTQYANSCYTFAGLDGGTDGGGWIWSQGYVDPLTQIQTTVNNSDGGQLCCTYSAQ